MTKDNDFPVLEKRVKYNDAYLKQLLKDVTFVSYLNVFLNLPIFPRRLTYIPSTKRFNIEPVLLRKYIHPHYGKLYSWLCEERLPIFTKSHLYFHYRLCKRLCKENPVIKSLHLLEAQCPDLPSIRDISGFYNFHHFMLEGTGSVIINCWLDIEKLHYLDNGNKAAFLEDFFDNYLYSDSPNIIFDHYRHTAFQQISNICRGVRFVKRNVRGNPAFMQQFKDKLMREKKLFRPLQELLTEDLRSYWLPRYYVSLSKRVGDTRRVIKRSPSILHKLITSPTSPEQDILESDSVPLPWTVKLCTSDGLRQTSTMVYDHKIGMDVSMDECDVTERGKSLTEQNMKHFLSRVEEECVETRRRSTLANINPILLNNYPPVTKGDRRASTRKSLQVETLDRMPGGLSPARNRHSFRSMSVSVRRTESGSFSVGTARHESFDMQKQRMVEKIQNGRRPSGLNKTVVSKIIDWSRHKKSRTKEGSTEKYLEEELELYRCCPCSLSDEIYKENYCDALKQVFNETSLKEVDINNLLEVSISSDAIAGGDFKSFLLRNSEKTSVYNYEFWVAIENFCNKYSTEESMMFCARGYAMNIIGFFSEQTKVSFDWNYTKNRMVAAPIGLGNFEKELHSLLYQYTHPDGSKFTDWNDPFTDSLWFAIVNNHSAQEWLSLAQKFAAKKLLPEWLLYIEEKENEFLQKCTVFKDNTAPPLFLHHTSEDLIFETINSPNSQIMWGAMQLAEAVEYPGQNLPIIGKAERVRSNNISPDLRSGISSLSSPSPHGNTSPTKAFSESKPPNRRLLAGADTSDSASLDAIAENIQPEEGSNVPPSSMSSRRGDALASMMSMTDPTLSQLEYNLFNTSGLDLSTEKVTTIPKNFQDILRTKELLAKFRQFLLDNDDNQDPSVLFYQIVESLKSTRNPKQRQERMQFILQKFFGPVSSLKTKLMIDKNCNVYKELCGTKKVTHTMLITAQTLILNEMESVYWLQFVEAFPPHIREKIISMNTRARTLEKKEFGKEKNRRLWVNFTINVINFKNGIMDPKICKHFKQFLADYIKGISAKCTKNTQKRQVVNNKLIDIEKIQADLDFFIEVEKYKEICESVQASARQGNYNPGEEELLIQKGRVLYLCYIDSLLPPKVQINITHDKVTEIRKLHESGLFERGMFHDAALSLFPSLTYFWKKFCLQRYAPSCLQLVESDKLIIKERNGKGDMLRSRGVRAGTSKQETKPNTCNMTVIHVSHVAHGVIHLMNRYSESAGLLQLLCSNNPSAFRRGALADNVPTIIRSTLPDVKTQPDNSNLRLGLSIKPGDRRLSAMTNYDQRKNSIMTPGKLKVLRE